MAKTKTVGFVIGRTLGGELCLLPDLALGGWIRSIDFLSGSKRFDVWVFASRTEARAQMKQLTVKARILSIEAPARRLPRRVSWSLAWRTPVMRAHAFWYFATQKAAVAAAAKFDDFTLWKIARLAQPLTIVGNEA